MFCIACEEEFEDTKEEQISKKNRYQRRTDIEEEQIPKKNRYQRRTDTKEEQISKKNRYQRRTDTKEEQIPKKNRYRRRTDNTKAKRKRTKGQTTTYTKQTYKTKDRVTRTPLKQGVNSCAQLNDAITVV
jgi:hypothetical protein